VGFHVCMSMAPCSSELIRTAVHLLTCLTHAVNLTMAADFLSVELMVDVHGTGQV